MICFRTLVVSTAVAFSLPFGVAFAQTASAATAVSPGPDQSKSQPVSPDDVRSPMQEQAMVPNTAPISTVCGPHDSVMMKDEFGRTYNCRGDRVR